MPHKNVSFERWFDIFRLTIITCFIYFLLVPFTEPSISKFINIIGFYPISLLWMFYSLILSILLIPAVRYGGFSVCSFYKYPPFWLAAVIDLLIIWFSKHYISKSSSWGISLEYLLWIFSIALTGVFLSVGYYKLIKYFNKTNQKISEQITGESSVDDIKSLLQWIEQETPIETPFQDRLNTKVIADRIAEVLSKSPLITISVVGGYGTGKSSILHMVRNNLKSNEAEKNQINQ